MLFHGMAFLGCGESLVVVEGVARRYVKLTMNVPASPRARKEG